MKTIKEINNYLENQYPVADGNMLGYLEALKDIIKLIDEMPSEGYNRINRVILKQKIQGEN